MEIKNIIFDMGGVLVDLERERCVSAFARLGFPGFGGYLDTYRQKGFFAAFENGDITEEEFRAEVRRHIPADAAGTVSDSDIDNALQQFLTGIKPYKAAFVHTLRGRFRLFVLSNINPICWRYSQQLFRQAGGGEMTGLFERCFLSYEMNCSKPEPEIFRRMIGEAGLRPQESLFIDDSPLNIKAGAAAGLRVLLYDVRTDLAEKVTEALQAW